MGIIEFNEMRVLRDEKDRLKKLAADLTLDKTYPTGSTVKKSLRPAHLRVLLHRCENPTE